MKSKKYLTDLAVRETGQTLGGTKVCTLYNVYQIDSPKDIKRILT